MISDSAMVIVEAGVAMVGRAWRAAFAAGREAGESRPALRDLILAALTALLFVPLFASSLLLARAAWRLLSDDMLFILGFLLAMPALMTVAAAAAAVGFGVTVGAWVVLERPRARIWAAVLAVVAGGSAGMALGLGLDEVRLLSWSTIVLSALALALQALPRTELRIAAAVEPPLLHGGPRRVAPTVTDAVARHRRSKRFVL